MPVGNRVIAFVRTDAGAAIADGACIMKDGRLVVTPTGELVPGMQKLCEMVNTVGNDRLLMILSDEQDNLTVLPAPENTPQDVIDRVNARQEAMDIANART